jgi:hypothetical protein
MTWSRAVIALVFVLTADAASACVMDSCDWKTDALRDASPAARDAYQSGNFIAAAEIAAMNGSAPALTFAARARIADAITRDDGVCLPCLVHAEEVAQAAIDATPSTPQVKAAAYAQLAIAIGFRGRLLSTFEAQSEGLAEKGHAAIEQALELDPLNSWARASLGGWNLEIVHRAGGTLASVLYGATEEEGLKQFRAALSQDRGSLLLHFHYALSILALDPIKFRDEALLTLQAGYKDPGADALTAFTRKRTDHLLDTLRTGSADDIAKLVRRDQGYPDD